MNAGGKVIIKERALQNRFATLPVPVLYCKKLSMSAKVVYAAIIDYVWGLGKMSCFPAQATLAEKLGVCEDTVRKYLQELQEQKWLDWERRGQGKTNVYYLLEFPVEEKEESKAQASEQEQEEKQTPSLPNPSAFEPATATGKRIKREEKQGEEVFSTDETRFDKHKEKKEEDYNANDLELVFKEEMKKKWPKMVVVKWSVKEKSQAKSLLEEFGVKDVLAAIRWTIVKWEFLSVKWKLYGQPSVGFILGWKKSVMPLIYLEDKDAFPEEFKSKKGAAQFTSSQSRKDGNEAGWDN